MSREMVLTFFPVTFGELKKHAAPVFYYLFPDWVAERCPMPSVDLQGPFFPSTTLFWPAAAATILLGLLFSWFLGTRSFLRALHEGAQSRQGMFLWSASLLWYGCMCIGGLFFHCFHVYDLPHMLDLVGTGLASLSVMGGFSAFAGGVDDRTGKQRLGLLGLALVFVVVVIVAPPLVQEQLYMIPALLASLAGVRFLGKQCCKMQGDGAIAQRWLWMSALGVVLGLGALPLDRGLCVTVGVDFALLFWFFLGCHIAILSTHQFALVVIDNNLHFTEVKVQ